MKTAYKTEFGDFQTPLPLAREVCNLLRSLGVKADVIIEPTCGLGSFLEAGAESYPKAQLLGFEFNARHLEHARARLEERAAPGRWQLRQRDFFSFDWHAAVRQWKGRLLILGNPPWVTNSTVSSLNGANLPVKENFQGLRGLAAKTGKSNFDISEWMLIRLINALRGREAALAMLCKTATARKVLRYAWQNDGRVARASLHSIDAKEHFGASVEACLLLVDLGKSGPAEAAVFESLGASHPIRRLGMAGQDLVADLEAYERLRHLEGLSPYQWRSGLKHDCASVMEFQPLGDSCFRNKLGETVRLESHYVYPLLKCTELSKGCCAPERRVLVTQRHTGEETADIARRAPLTWKYLQRHQSAFHARKSSIYAGRPPFALFGIGDYAFAPWKVAISGLHRSPRFVLVPPQDERPVMFDDTCYYVPFAEETESRVVASILNSEPCRQFLEALMFPAAKRPMSVELLQRLDIAAIAEEAGLSKAWRASRQVDYTTGAETSQLQFMMETPARTVSPPGRTRRDQIKRR